MNTTKLKSKFWAWSAFDAGNSAHALLVSTVGFALYFQQVLFRDNAQATSLWALLTAVVLSVSGLASPFLTSWLSFKQIRWVGLWITTIGCVAATMALSLPLSVWSAIGFYFFSAVGYYLALPIYNTYLEEVAEGKPEKASARGWAIGYLGGVLVAALAFVLGMLSKPVTERPDLYRQLFLLAGIFNLVLSLPIMVWAFISERQSKSQPSSVSRWSFSQVFSVFRQNPNLIRLLLSYWMVGECGTITIYFTAIFLAQYAHMPAAKIFALTLVLQLIGFFSTWIVGDVSDRFGSKSAYRIVCYLWTVVPVLLWGISLGWSYWLAILAIGLVIGAHHVIVRSEVAKIASTSGMSPEAKGSVFGFLEITGRITSVLGPLAIGIATFFLPLSTSLLIACAFPLLALVAIFKYRWV